MAEALYPRGGWRRAAGYVMHRVRRLPDTPEKISRGIAAGVMAAWTPFYGLHFIVAAVFARAVRGNLGAALIGTFFGNPLTYVPIGVIALETGHLILGRRPQRGLSESLIDKFTAAGQDLADNLLALFGPERADWHGLAAFYDDLFLPYLIGGLVPGLVCATASYHVVLPLIRAYQNSRRKKLRMRLERLGKLPGSGTTPPH